MAGSTFLFGAAAGIGFYALVITPMLLVLDPDLYVDVFDQFEVAVENEVLTPKLICEELSNSHYSAIEQLNDELPVDLEIVVDVDACAKAFSTRALTL